MCCSGCRYLQKHIKILGSRQARPAFLPAKVRTALPARHGFVTLAFPAKTPLHSLPEYCARGGLDSVLAEARRDPAAAAELTWKRRISLVGALVCAIFYANFSAELAHWAACSPPHLLLHQALPVLPFCSHTAAGRGTRHAVPPPPLRAGAAPRPGAWPRVLGMSRPACASVQGGWQANGAAG